MFHDAPLIALNAQHFLNDTKHDDNHLYLHQQHTVQIIQLVEGPPPPPRNLASVINDSAGSSSYASSSAYSESCDNDAEDDDEEEVCESYCSSDEEDMQDLYTSSTDTYSLRMKRILSWRENFSSHLSATLSEPILPSTLKRKLTFDDHDSTSHSSKRSRSLTPSSVSGSSSLGLHSCPACDASFEDEQSLRQHGNDATANEACSVAVQYAFE